eukprot:TRINITY_DN3097_c0_g1_i3.p1 TRINITY_DN3097_c0_g1~~TRINITY_DN3097_c0_g1_i3.p1  ORF type:complete len:492 (+),score=42.62 TRINITY_DN3097_c0_g1_i3:70-1545(+)
MLRLQMASGLLAPDFPDFPIPNDVVGHVVSFLSIADLFKLELTCKGYQTGLWYDYVTQIDSIWFFGKSGFRPQVYRRFEARHKRIDSLILHGHDSYTEFGKLLVRLLPQLTSLIARSFDPFKPRNPICKLKNLNCARLHSLELDLSHNFKVETKGTMTVLQWFRAGLPNLRHLVIGIHHRGMVKDALEALLEGCSSLQNLEIIVGYDCIEHGEFAPGQLLSLLSSICLKNAPSLQRVFFHHGVLSMCAADAVRMGVGKSSFDEWNARCIKLFALPLSGLELHIAKCVRMWEYALHHTIDKTSYANFDRLFELCYESLRDKIHAVHNRRLVLLRNVPDYFIAKVKSFLPEIVVAPSETGAELVEILAIDSAIFFDALKQILIHSARSKLRFHLRAEVVLMLLNDAEFVATMGTSIAGILDHDRTFYSLLSAPETFLALIKAADVGIFSCCLHSHAELLRSILSRHKPSSPTYPMIKSAVKHILTLPLKMDWM